MKGVTFGTWHTSSENLILTKTDLGGADPEFYFEQIEGATEPLDYTEFFGDITYKQRLISFVFEYIGTDYNLLSSTLSNKLSGKKFNITLDDDPAYYFIGRIILAECARTGSTCYVKIDCTCNQYKYKQEKTIIELSVNGEEEITVINSRMRTTPAFTSTNEIMISFDDKQITTDSSKFTIDTLNFVEGENIIKFNGTSNITIEFQEGCL